MNCNRGAYTDFIQFYLIERRIIQMIQKILSGIIILLYIAGAYTAEGAGSALQVALFCLLPFFAIWFPNAMGNWTGTRFSGPSITSESPGCLVRLLGWVLLLLPLIIPFLLT